MLTPGRYVGAEAAEGDGEPFEEKMKRLVATLREQQADAAKLDEAIVANLKQLGFWRTAMTPEELRRLIAAGETLNVEFKGEERSPLNDRDLVEAVVCLANRSGTEPAWLLIGVEDDGRITGARPAPRHPPPILTSWPR